jgi:TRAP-type C4-dicarboxylate transport system substrate-binding protein
MKAIPILIGAILALAAPAAAEINLRAASRLPGALSFGKHFLAYVEEANKRGKGRVRIRVLGDAGQRTAPLSPNAVRSGLIDIDFGPAGDHATLVPEVAALLGSNVKAPEMRRSGAMALMSQIYRTRMGVHFLGMLNAGVRMHLYLARAPRLIDGSPRLTGARIQTGPVFREFVASLGGEPFAATSIATGAKADEAADGMILPRLGLARHAAGNAPIYRIDPGFSRLATVAVVNIMSWARLPREIRALLTEVMIDHERKSYIAMRALAEQEEEQALEQGGLRVIALKGAARKAYLGAMARAVQARLEKADPAYRAHLEYMLLNR